MGVLCTIKYFSYPQAINENAPTKKSFVTKALKCQTTCVKSAFLCKYENIEKRITNMGIV